MRGSFKPFLISLLLSLGVLAPFVWCGLLYYDHAHSTEPAAQAQSGVPITPGAQESMLLLLAVAPSEEVPAPSLTLLRLDCPHGRITACPLPAETVLRSPGGSVQLGESYLTAGPGRAAQLLSETLEMPVPLYLSATPAGWESLLRSPQLRLDTSSLLDSAQRQTLGLEEPLLEFSLPQAAALCVQCKTLLPGCYPSLRNAVWESSLQQLRPDLGTLPAMLRAQSSRLLTSLSATDLLRLERILSYLSSAAGIQVKVQSMPGETQGQNFALNEQSLALAAQFTG